MCVERWPFSAEVFPLQSLSRSQDENSSIKTLKTARNCINSSFIICNFSQKDENVCSSFMFPAKWFHSHVLSCRFLIIHQEQMLPWIFSLREHCNCQYFQNVGGTNSTWMKDCNASAFLSSRNWLTLAKTIASYSPRGKQHNRMSSYDIANVLYATVQRRWK